MQKIRRTARGHFVRLIEIRVHLIKAISGHNVSAAIFEAINVSLNCMSHLQKQTFPFATFASPQPILSHSKTISFHINYLQTFPSHSSISVAFSVAMRYLL